MLEGFFQPLEAQPIPPKAEPREKRKWREITGGGDIVSNTCRFVFLVGMRAASAVGSVKRWSYLAQTLQSDRSAPPEEVLPVVSTTRFPREKFDFKEGDSAFGDVVTIASAIGTLVTEATKAGRDTLRTLGLKGTARLIGQTAMNEVNKHRPLFNLKRDLELVAQPAVTAQDTPATLEPSTEPVMPGVYIPIMPDMSGAEAIDFGSGISTTNAPIVIAVPAIETAF